MRLRCHWLGSDRLRSCRLRSSRNLRSRGLRCRRLRRTRLIHHIAGTETTQYTGHKTQLTAIAHPKTVHAAACAKCSSARAP